MSPVHASVESRARIYWTAFIGLFFDYYDLYLFVYLERTLAAHFALTALQSDTLQFTGLAGVGAGALVFGWLADRFGRGRMMLAVFGVYFAGIVGLSAAWSFSTLLLFRLLASLALGAEWGISHAYLAERVSRETRYRFSALLQFAILGGLLAALAVRFLLPALGWRWLFLASIPPVALLALVRWRALAAAPAPEDSGAAWPDAARRERSRHAPTHGGDALPSARSSPEPRWGQRSPRFEGVRGALGSKGKGRAETPDAGRQRSGDFGRFLICLAIASLTIASGTVNVFLAKDFPQGVWYTVLFWGNLAPGLLIGAWIVRRAGVRRALTIYSVGLLLLSLGALASSWPHRHLAFALVLPLLNGIPFGLMGAWFNEMFVGYRTMYSGSAYNLGRILAGFSPYLITALGLHEGGRYFLFTAFLGVGVVALGALIRPAGWDPLESTCRHASLSIL